ncbi:hypothetical protein [Saccharothrix deserti]|nr:hypothetical protein [Saccharothrix deserti]
MIDIAEQLKAIHREVRAGTADTVGVLLRPTRTTPTRRTCGTR